jgi:Ala-tRNA(Pro) deacylase
MRVTNYLTDQSVLFETVVHPPAYTATRRARALHVSGKLLAKCVLLVGPRGYVLAVLPATHQIDLKLLSVVLQGQVRLAAVEEIPEIFRDCEWGTLVPFGTLYGVPTILEDSFTSEALLVFEAHQHALAIRMRCRDFERLEKPRRLAFGRAGANQTGIPQADGFSVSAD